jgi:hypothetical protein
MLENKLAAWEFFFCPMISGRLDRLIFSISAKNLENLKNLDAQKKFQHAQKVLGSF